MTGKKQKKARSKWRAGRHRPTAPPVGGESPGTLRIHPNAPRPVFDLITYSQNSFQEQRLDALPDLPQPIEGQVIWLNISGFGDLPTLHRLGERLSLHPLALEDAVHTDQRAKVDTYDEWTFIVACMASRVENVTVLEQVSLFVRSGLVVSFQELPQDCFEPVRRRLRQSASRLRSRGADYLAYALLDVLIDSYFPCLESFGDHLENLEDTILAAPSESTLEELHHFRRELILLRKAVLPHREAINALMRSDVQPFTEETRVFLRDCYDHTIRVIEMIESFREFAASLMDVYLSTLGQKTNEVMRVLTVISTIFIPLSFLAGLYGMNFDTSHPLNMPELRSPFGYPGLLAIMAGIVISLLAFFRRRGWF